LVRGVVNSAPRARVLASAGSLSDVGSLTLAVMDVGDTNTPIAESAWLATVAGQRCAMHACTQHAGDDVVRHAMAQCVASHIVARRSAACHVAAAFVV
jgi:hypothetical protein